MTEPLPAQIKPEDRLLIRSLRAVNLGITRIYHHTVVRTTCTLPAEGPAILVSNHTSGLDPLMLQSASPRLIVWMMAKEYYDIWPLRWFFQQIHAIPVQRSGRDMAAMRAAMRSLEEGHVLGLFPEGRIERTRDLMPFQTGVALMAIKTGAPVYPAYIDGTQRRKSMTEAFTIPNRAAVAFGPVVEFDRNSTSRDSLESATVAIQSAVERLKARFKPIT